MTKNGRFSHPRSRTRFATSAAALLSAQRVAESADGEIQLGVFEDDETAGRVQLLRVERRGDVVYTTKIAEAIREEPNLMAASTRKRNTTKGGTNPDGTKGGTRTEDPNSTVAEDAVDHTDPNSTVADEIVAETVEVVAEAVAETTEPKAKRTPKAKAEPVSTNGEFDRAAIAKRLGAKIKRDGRIPAERQDIATKYAVRIQLHKDGFRTKPTDFARQGLTTEDVAVLSEVV
jgi:hypothetical protein